MKWAADTSLPAALEFLERMVAVNSYTLNPAGVNAVGALVAEAFAPLGFEAENVPAGSPEFGAHLFLRGVLQPGLPAIAFISHLDTVFPPEEELRNDFSWRREGDRIYGPGTNDIKGGTALAWMMLATLRRERPDLFARANWFVALNACEEVDSNDFGEACVARFPAGTTCLIVEGDGGSIAGGLRVVGCRKGRATFTVHVEGRGAHAGSSHPHGANAIVELCRVIGEISALTDYADGVTVNAGSITGGGPANRVPHEASAILEMRAWDPAAFARTRDAILARAGAGLHRSDDGFACHIEISVTDETAPWPENPGTERLVQIWRECAADQGLALDGQSRGGLSDGNVLWRHFPTIDGLGPCGENSHCSEQSPDGTKEQEWVDAASFVPKANLNLAAIERLLAPDSKT